MVQSLHIIYRLSFRLSLFVGFNDRGVIDEFWPAGAGPCAHKPCAILAFLFRAFATDAIVFLVGMLAKAFEIICAMSRDIVEAPAFAFWNFAMRLFPLRIQIFVFFKAMIAKAFGLRPNHFAFDTFTISPTQIKLIVTFLRDRQLGCIYDIQFLILQ